MGNLSTLDLDGNARVVGSAVDMGAYERQTVDAKEILAGSVSVSPNPATDFVMLQWPETLDLQLEMQVFDADGRELLRRQLSAWERLDVRDLPAGVYTLKVLDNNRIFTGKFVKH